MNAFSNVGRKIVFSDAEKARIVRALESNDAPKREIAKRFGISVRTLERIAAENGARYSKDSMLFRKT